MINDSPEFKRLITSEEFINEFMNGFELSDDDYDSPYCSVCGSCGESGCCSPDMCKSVQLELAIKSVLIDMVPDEEFNVLYFIEELQNRMKCGSYCDWNVKSYKDMEKECDKYYLALKDLEKFFISKNEVSVERATILTRTFNEIVGDLI
jgi:hypothetical protein